MADEIPAQRERQCHGCEDRPIRESGEPVSWMEGMTEQLLYCQPCADECAAGEWDRDPDEETP